MIIQTNRDNGSSSLIDVDKLQKSLFLAVNQLDGLLVKNLQQKGANINHPYYKNGSTLLHRFSEVGDCERVEFLLNHGAKINSTTKSGHTALHYICRNAHTQIGKLLLERKCEVNANGDKLINIKNNKGHTALHIACTYGQIEVVKLLLDHNSEINPIDNNNKTPLYYAFKRFNKKDQEEDKKKQYEDIISFLFQKGGERFTEENIIIGLTVMPEDTRFHVKKEPPDSGRNNCLTRKLHL